MKGLAGFGGLEDTAGVWYGGLVGDCVVFNGLLPLGIRFSGLGLRDAIRSPEPKTEALLDPKSIDICFVAFTRGTGVGNGLPPARVGEEVFGFEDGVAVCGCEGDVYDDLEYELDIDPGGVFSTAGRVGEEGVGAATWMGFEFTFELAGKFGNVWCRETGGMDSGRALGMGRGRPLADGGRAIPGPG